MQIKDSIKTEFKIQVVKPKWIDKILEPLQAEAHKACRQHNATKIQVILSHQHHTHGLRSHRLDRLAEALRECSNPKVKIN